MSKKSKVGDVCEVFKDVFETCKPTECLFCHRCLQVQVFVAFSFLKLIP